MKHTFKNIIGTLSLSAVALTASAQVTGETSPAGSTRPEQSQDPRQIRTSSGINPADQTSRPIRAVKADEFIGMDVVNLQDEALGSVSEIAVDVESGRIVGVILSTGGFLGIGASETVVPPSAFVLNDDNTQLQLDANKDRLLAAPRFDTSEWSEAFTNERLTSVYKHFGMESSYDFVDEAEQPSKPFNVPASRLKSIQRGSEIIGMEVATPRNEEIGEISEIILDLPAGRIVALIVTTGEFLDIENELSAIPASSFRLNADRETLLVDTSKAALEAAPHFQENQWPDFTQEKTVSAIFSAHSVEPYTRSTSVTSRSSTTGGSQETASPLVATGRDQDATGRTTAGRDQEKASPLVATGRDQETPGRITTGGNQATAGRPMTTGKDQDTAPEPKQGKNSADMATTSAIQKEIRANEKLSLNARNVTVVTSEGHTTLSGPVDTVDEKQVIGEIANRNNREEDVKNLLVVKATTTKSE